MTKSTTVSLDRLVHVMLLEYKTSIRRFSSWCCRSRQRCQIGLAAKWRYVSALFTEDLDCALPCALDHAPASWGCE